MEEKYLPIGSVCLLKGGQRYVVVIGYLGVSNDDMNTVYDYMGAVYPIGVITSDVSFMFNHEQIDKVLFRGFEDEESKEFNKKLNELSKEDVIKKMKDAAAAQNGVTPEEKAAGAQTAVPNMPGTPVQAPITSGQTVTGPFNTMQ